MDDPDHAASRKEDLDHFRKAKFGRTKSYAYGDAMGLRTSRLKKLSNHTTQPTQRFTTSNSARACCVTSDVLDIVPEDCHVLPSEDEETDVGDSPCPPSSKNTGFKAKKLGLGGSRGPLMRAETYGPSRYESAR